MGIKKSHPGRLHRIGECIIGGLVVLHFVPHLLGLVGTGEATASDRAVTTAARVCFSAASWDARDSLRPCVHVLHVEEDGSFAASVTDANGTERYSIGVGVPDAYEGGR